MVFATSEKEWTTRWVDIQLKLDLTEQDKLQKIRYMLWSTVHAPYSSGNRIAVSTLKTSRAASVSVTCVPSWPSGASDVLVARRSADDHDGFGSCAAYHRSHDRVMGCMRRDSWRGFSSKHRASLQVIYCLSYRLQQPPYDGLIG